MTGTAVTPSSARGWRSFWDTTRDTGLTIVNRVAFGFSLVVLAVTLARMADADWTNFRRHVGYHVFVVGWLAILTYGVRSVGSRELARHWLIGFFPVAFVAYVLGELTESVLGTGNSQIGVAVPLVEEVVKFLPLVLWTTLLRPRHRHGTLSDFLLLGFVIGAGFSFHEDALYVRVAASGFDDGVLGTLLPISLDTGEQYAITHAGWTALAGVGVGIVSLHRHRTVARFSGAALIAAPIVDHAAVNWIGDNGDAFRSATVDGRLAAWLLLAVVVGVVIHDRGTLRWIAAGDREFPRPSVGGDLAAAARGSPTERLSGLLVRQRYRRRRNAVLIDLFSVRSRGVSAGDRRGVRAELEFARNRAGIEPAASTAPRRRLTAPMPASVTDEERARRRRLVASGLGAIVIALVAFLALRSSTNEDAVGDDLTAPVPSTTPLTGTDVAIPDESGTALDEIASTGGGLGPEISEPVRIRWVYSDESGNTDEIVLAIDGDREIWIRGPHLQYQDATGAVDCFDEGGDVLRCFAKPRGPSLATEGWTDPAQLEDLPGATVESAEISGRDAVCVAVASGDGTATRSCYDDATGVEVLTESESVSIVGADLSWRVELVDWSAPAEADFDLPDEARAALAED